MKLFLMAAGAFLYCLTWVQAADEAKQVPVTFTGGYETESQDRGRPDVLIAAALGVPTEVFRKAFSGVHPAGPGEGGPTPDRARDNKRVLMAALGPYGVTDERLNEVSNWYRYRREGGELWKHVPATAYATVSHGVVTGFVITKPGAGYSSPPMVSVAGFPELKAVAVLSFGTDLEKNGSVKEIRLNPRATP